MHACTTIDRRNTDPKPCPGCILLVASFDHTTHMHKAMAHHAHTHVHIFHILTTPAQTSLVSNPSHKTYSYTQEKVACPFSYLCRHSFFVPRLSLNLLALELGQARRHIGPLLLAVDQADDGARNLLEPAPHLLRRVTVAQRERVVLDRLEVDRDAKGRAQLVVALVSPLASLFFHNKTRIKLTE
jgi:hypothetical protein